MVRELRNAMESWRRVNIDELVKFHGVSSRLVMVLRKWRVEKGGPRSVWASLWFFVVFLSVGGLLGLEDRKLLSSF